MIRALRVEWFLPLFELPHAYNPAKNFIALPSQDHPDGYRHEINFEWAAPFRFNRIEEVLGRGSNFTVEDFKRLQHDEASLPARELVPLLKGRLADFPHGTRAAPSCFYDGMVFWLKSPPEQPLRNVDEKLGATFADRVLPSEAKSLVGSGSLFTTMLRVLKSPDAKWFGANPGPKAATRYR